VFCLILIGLTLNLISFLDYRLIEVLFGYMSISKISPVIKSKTK